MPTSPNLRGLVPATVLPMDKNANIDLDALKGYVAWMRSQTGIVGLAVNVDTGEGSHLTQEERDEVLRTYKVNAVGLSIVAGITARYTQEAKEMSRRAQRGGADALLIFPPPAFSGSPLPANMVSTYHKAIASSVRIPLLAFQLYSQLGGVEYSSDVIKSLMGVEQVCGIKDASSDYHRFVSLMNTCRAGRKNFVVLTGNDTFILESLIAGADGALVGFGTVAVKQQVDMIRYVRKQDFGQALEIWKSLLPLVEVIFAPPARDYRARLKEALVELGVIPLATVRPPLLPVSSAEKAKIAKTLKNTGLLP